MMIKWFCFGVYKNEHFSDKGRINIVLECDKEKKLKQRINALAWDRLGLSFLSSHHFSSDFFPLILFLVFPNIILKSGYFCRLSSQQSFASVREIPHAHGYPARIERQSLQPRLFPRLRTTAEILFKHFQVRPSEGLSRRLMEVFRSN